MSSLLSKFWNLAAAGCCALLLAGRLDAQQAVTFQSDTTLDSAASGWQNYNWLQAGDDKARQAAAGDSYSVNRVQIRTDPFALLSGDALWQDAYQGVYAKQFNENLVLNYTTTKAFASDDASTPLTASLPDSSTRAQQLGVQVQAADGLKLGSNVHYTSMDGFSPADSSTTTGFGFSAESRLPFNSTLTLAMASDRSVTGTNTYTGISEGTYYDAQWQQPLGNLPLTAVLKGHYEETSNAGSLATRLPSLEQSLVWKPVDSVTFEMGLRQQHYEDFPGVTNDLNEAIFADWSQKIMPEVTWHSYAEMLNSKNLQDTGGPVVPITSGANGTPQTTVNNMSLGSTLPLSFESRTITFSTGPSFLLQKDISASIEYSNRWDQNPQVGSVGQEQRISFSLKGSF